MDDAIDAGEFLLRLRQRHAGSQSREDGEVAIGIRIGERFIGEQRLRAERKPHVRALVDPASEEALRHDADNDEWLALNGEHGAQDGRRVGEGAGPEAMAEHDRHTGGAGVLVCRAESAAGRGPAPSM